MTSTNKKKEAKASNQEYEWIGTCPAGKFLGKQSLVLNPYWQKLEFLQRNPQFKIPADESTSAKHVSMPDTSSPNESTPEISSSGQTPSTFETEQDFNILLANAGSDTANPLGFGNGLSPTTSPSLTNGAVADFSSPDEGLAGQDYTFSNKFTIERRQKQKRRRRV